VRPPLPIHQRFSGKARIYIMDPVEGAAN
jgi:hypothetical protein